MARANPAAAAIHHTAVQIVGGCESDGMQQKVQLAPFCAYPLEYRLQLTRDAHIAGQQQFAAQGVGDRTDIRQRFVVQVGCREVGTCSEERARTASGDAGLIGNADDEAALAGQAGCKGKMHQR